MSPVSEYDYAVAKMRFELYHTVTIGDAIYALHPEGVSHDDTVVCCNTCGKKLRNCQAKMTRMVAKSRDPLFFKFDPTVGKNEYITNNNVVRMRPINDTWLEWDYGKVISYYIDESGKRIDFTDSNGNPVSFCDLSDGEVQALSPFLVASKIIKLSSSYDKHIGHKIRGHIMTLPTASNREIYKTRRAELPRLDVAEHNRIMYLGTVGNYTSKIAFRLNSKRHAMRQSVVESFLKGMRQANEHFAASTRFRKATAQEWKNQVDTYQGDIIAEPKEHAQNVEKMMRSDVAKGWNTKPNTHQNDSSADAEFTNVMVTRNGPIDPDEHMLRSILHLHSEIESKDDLDKPMQVRIQNGPLNEYTNNPELLHLGFPLLFPLGITWRQIRSTGLMQKSTIRRLLCSADGRFARSKTFIFLLVNQNMRHDNNLSVALRINASTELSRKFVDFINSEEFDRLCTLAAANPKGKEARVLLAKVRPFVSTSGKTTKWSALERAAVKGKLFSMAQVFNPSALFLSFSPKALDCELVVRNAAMQLGVSEVAIVRLLRAESLNERVRMVSDNPVAQARAFEHMVRGFCDVILGLKRYKEQKGSDQTNGLFGRTLSYFGPIETQHRGTLHLHVNVQVAELQPALLQRFAHQPHVVQAFVRQIDSIVTGSTRGFEHIHSAAQKERLTAMLKQHNKTLNGDATTICNMPGGDTNPSKTHVRCV